MEKSIEFTTGSPEQTQRVAARIASACRANDVLALEGTLGAGKTCFVKGLARGLGIEDTRAVASPSFVLLKVYEGDLTLYHFDAYRLRGSADMEAIGCGETFALGGVSVVEWADHVARCLPEEHFVIAIAVTGEITREFRISAVGGGCRSRLDDFRKAVSE